MVYRDYQVDLNVAMMLPHFFLSSIIFPFSLYLLTANCMTGSVLGTRGGQALWLPSESSQSGLRGLHDIWHLVCPDSPVTDPTPVF